MTEYTVEHLNGFAVDLGGTKLAAARVQNGEVDELIVRRTDGEAGPMQLVSDLSDIARQIGFAKDQPIGVAVTGRLDSRGRWSAVNTSILNDLKDLPLVEHLERHLGSNVVALNDTRAAVIGEHRFGAGKGQSTLAYLTVSTGISVGIVLNGTALQSQNGMLGHIGFVPSKFGKGLCGSGRTATYETVASGRAIEARAMELGHQDIDCESIFKEAAGGADWAGRLVNDSGAAIAELCASLSAVLGVECVVLGGGVGLANGYLDLVRDHLRKEPDQFRPEVVRAALGKNSALFGALSCALDRKNSRENSGIRH